MQSKNAVIAVNRFGLGARPTDSAAIGRDAVGWLESQLDGASRDSMAPAPRPESAVTLERITELRLARQLANQRAAEIGGAARRRAADQGSQSGSSDNRGDNNRAKSAPLTTNRRTITRLIACRGSPCCCMI